MSEIQTWYDDYAKECSAFNTIVAQIRNEMVAEPQDQKEIGRLIADAETKATRIRDVKKSYGLELRLVKDRNSRAEFDAMAKELDIAYTKHTAELRTFKSQHAKKELMAGMPVTGTQLTTAGKTNDELLAAANTLQDQSFESLARTKNLMESSIAVGTDTIEELRKQRDQIKDIENDVDNLGGTLVRAEKLLLEFTRRLATDRIIQGFAFLNVVVMLALLLYLAISGKALGAINRTAAYFTAAPSPIPTSMPSIPTEMPSFRPTNVGDTLEPTFEPTFVPTF